MIECLIVVSHYTKSYHQLQLLGARVAPLLTAFWAYLIPVLNQPAGNPTATGYANITEAMGQADVARIVAVSTITWS